MHHLAAFLNVALLSVAGCTAAEAPSAERQGVSASRSASASPQAAVSSAPVTSGAWSAQFSAVCRTQALLTPSMTNPTGADPDAVELGVRQLAEAAAKVPAPPADRVVADAYAQLDVAAESWLRLATATTTTRDERRGAAQQLQAAVSALVAAGAADCSRLLADPAARSQ